jgi:DNA polymerase-3 subunit epsilon
MNRSSIVFGAVGLAVVAALGASIGLVVTGAVGPDLLVLLLVVDLALILSALALAWAWVQLRVERPVRRLVDDLHLIAFGNPEHRCSVEPGHALGSLPESVDSLAAEFMRARTEMAKAMATAGSRAERSRARMEAILRDLSEGVVVCTPQHRVVLFNDAAAAMLSGGHGLGLNRSITELVAQQPLRDALSRLYRQHEARAPRQTAEFRCDPVDGGPLRARMQLVLEPHRGISGYVLCLDAGATQVALPDIEDRPAYYDFDLFDAVEDRGLRDITLSRLDCVVFDTETTGLRPSRGDRIVQLAGVRVVNGRPCPGEVFDRLTNPGIPIPAASTRIHGITDEMVRDAPPVAEAVREFHRWVDGHVLVAHNAAFDMRFLELQEPESGVDFHQPVLDTLLLSLLLTPEHQDHTLDAIIGRLGVDTARLERHRALGDALVTAEVYARMLAPLAARDIQTLGEALDRSASLYRIRREQRRF